ncbi:hypothetical protein N9924_00320 [bacterium]|nr:hypothetical protein [bacterium]
MTLTLQEIRDHSPCQLGWKKLTKAVGNDMTTKLSIGDVVLSNGLDDALWCFRCLDPRKRVAAIIPAVKRAAVHSKDQRVHDCVKDIEKWLAGDNSINLYAAEAAADAAAWSASWALRAARSALWAARTAAWAALAAASAVGEAAGSAAVNAAVEAARAALAAADAVAVGDAAVDAARAAREAAWAEERELQKSDLLKMFPPMILKGETE